MSLDPSVNQEFEEFSVQDPFRIKVRMAGLNAARALFEGRAIERTQDPLIDRHLVRVEKQFHSVEIQTRLQKFGLPLVHRRAEELIRLTIGGTGPITNRDVQLAVLTAWATLLRQTVGSCFATAPAIFIQEEDPTRLFDDLLQLLTTGELVRVVEGRQLRAPLSPNWGMGEWMRPFKREAVLSPGIQKALQSASISISDIREWSRCRTPEELVRRVLLQAFHVSEERALSTPLPVLRGEVVIHKKTPLSAWKEAYERAKQTFLSFADCPLIRAWEYTIASFCDVKTQFSSWNLFVSLGLNLEERGGLAALLYREIDERLQEWNDRIQQAKGVARQEAIGIAEGLTFLYEKCIRSWILKFPESFQEVYDPSLLQAEGGEFEDLPAGFRLVYKGGRGGAASWEPIESADQFLDCLREFLGQTEREIVRESHFPRGREIIGQITTSLIQKIQQPPFLKEAIARSVLHHGKRATPWLYISGGTIETLLQSYYGFQQPLEKETRQIRSQRDLLEWVLLQAEKVRAPCLMYSPTHVFVFHPEWIGGDELIRWGDSNWSNWMFAFLRDPQTRAPIFCRVNEKRAISMAAWAEGEWGIFPKLGLNS